MVKKIVLWREHFEITVEDISVENFFGIRIENTVINCLFSETINRYGTKGCLLEQRLSVTIYL